MTLNIKNIKEELNRLSDLREELFEEKRNLKYIFEGGNITINGIEAQKLDMTKSTRKEFIGKSLSLFKKINDLYYREYKEFLWVDFSKLKSGEMFNGSTSFIFNQAYKDEDILKHKPKSGDIDIIVPKDKAKNLWNLLKGLEGKEVIPKVKYIGNNRNSAGKLGDQINSLFEFDFDNGYRNFTQVDFELLSVEEDGTPDEFSRYAHSSSFEDASLGQKGVAHKYLLISLAGSIDFKKDIIVVTNSSTKDKYTIRKKNGKPLDSFTNIKFSVDKGLRLAFEKQGYQIDGKDVYKEIPTSKSTYEQSLETIFEILFNKKPSKTDIKKMWSFVGLVDLMKKYLDKKHILLTYERLIDRVWSPYAQKLERDDKNLDFSIKDNMISYFEDKFKIKRSKKIQEMIENYYKKY